MEQNLKLYDFIICEIFVCLAQFFFLFLFFALILMTILDFKKYE